MSTLIHHSNYETLNTHPIISDAVKAALTTTTTTNPAVPASFSAPTNAALSTGKYPKSTRFSHICINH